MTGPPGKKTRISHSSSYDECNDRPESVISVIFLLVPRAQVDHSLYQPVQVTMVYYDKTHRSVAMKLNTPQITDTRSLYVAFKKAFLVVQLRSLYVVAEVLPKDLHTLEYN